MPRTIWKFDVPLTDVAEIDMPAGAEIISAGVQEHTQNPVKVWAIVDSDAEVRCRHIIVRGTGHDLPPTEWQWPLKFIDTVQHGPFIWHLFDGGETE